MTEQNRLAELIKMADESVIIRRAVIDALGTKILELADVISGVIGSGGKVMSAGNGGSMALAMHLSSEMVVRLSADRNRQALPAMTLGVNPAALSAASNDYGWEHAFARQIQAIGRKGDLLLLLSTSGKASNLLKAAQAARDQGILTAALLGGTGAGLKTAVDRGIVVPHTSPQRVHEEHMFIVHLLSQAVERHLFV